jgi:hypothetical protein
VFLVLQVYSICGIKAYKISYYNDYGFQICEHDRWEAKQPQADTSSTIKLGNKISQKDPWEKVEIEQLNLMHLRIVKYPYPTKPNHPFKKIHESGNHINRNS